MAKIPFKVSARTARLIGSDNIASSEGALIELVKNAYDANAKNCIVIFDCLWLNYLNSITKTEYNSLLSSDEKHKKLIENWYKLDGNKYEFKPQKDSDQYLKALRYFKNKCSLYIVDNGEGMDQETIENNWMTIGTSNKLYDPFTSDKKRIKSGAKGIGRFALDKLGEQATMFTIPSNKNVGYRWFVNWNDFEERNQMLHSVSADLDLIKALRLTNVLDSEVKNFVRLQAFLKSKKFAYGTIIKISHLRDFWDKYNVKNIFESLEILVPPKETGDFNITVLSTAEQEQYGEVRSSFCDDFDYKLSVNFNSVTDISYTIERREFDIKKIDPLIFKEKEPRDMSKFPYDLTTLKKGSFTQKVSIEEINPKAFSENNIEIYKGIGRFRFVFYFMKLSQKDGERFASKSFSENKRREWLERFGGIKIYRDDFRVRPYGEKASNSYDWLGLGERARQSTFGPGQKGGAWRVGPNQVYGVINISRVENPELKDTSNRAGLIENETYFLFKDFITNLIHLVESDRHFIIRPMVVVQERLDELAEAKRQALLQAEEDLILLTEKRAFNKLKKNNIPLSKVEEKNINYAKGIKKLNEELEEHKTEIKILRGLASMGLTISTLSHELEEIANKLEFKVLKLDEAINKQIDKTAASKLSELKNPYELVHSISGLTDRLNKWLIFAKNSVKKDRRRASNIKLSSYFEEFTENWEEMLNSRKTKLIFQKDFNKLELLKSFKIDLDSIFNNLLINSLEAFHEGKTQKRQIFIDYELHGSGINFIYSDTGPGLSKSIKTPSDIFLPLFTTKSKMKSDVEGIGLGMWIVKSTIDEYNGRVEILNSKTGFKLKLSFPKISK
jgi:signal transduction histidine kinase